jgi:ankyrin repeat protein
MLHIAAANAMHDIIRFLLGRNADRNVRARDGKTPLDLARAKGDQTAVDLLAPAQVPVAPPSSQIPGAPAPPQATDVPAPTETAEVP